MLKRKRIRARGKFSFQSFFQKYSEGDSVAVVRELSQPASFPKRIQGRTGKIKGKRKTAYIVEINDFEKRKTYLIKPVHLKKITVSK